MTEPERCVDCGAGPYEGLELARLQRRDDDRLVCRDVDACAERQAAAIAELPRRKLNKLRRHAY